MLHTIKKVIVLLFLRSIYDFESEYPKYNTSKLHKTYENRSEIHAQEKGNRHVRIKLPTA